MLIQDYLRYTEEDHNTWAILFERQCRLILEKSSSEFQKGFHKLTLDPEHVANLEDVNKKMRKYTDWQVRAAPGLVSNKEFFGMLKEKQFPVTVDMRKPEDLDFSKLPDIFHDIYGHVPMLLNPLFCKFLNKYCDYALNFIENDDIINFFGRFYWYTLEMGLIREDDDLKPYGGAILTSSGEIDNIENPDTSKKEFEVLSMINSPFDNLKLQKKYYIINSYNELFDGLDLLEQILEKEFGKEISLKA